MNWGQNRAIESAKLVWRATLFVGVLCILAGVAAATDGLRAAPQPDRPWENYFGAAILPSGRAVVVGDKGVVMTSDDGGRTWIRQLLKKGPKYYDLYGVAFTADASHGWVVGDSETIFRTDDRGKTWSEQQAPAAANVALLKVAVADG